MLAKKGANDIAFNLGFSSVPSYYKERSFDVLVNSKEIISEFSNSEALKTDQTVATKSVVSIIIQARVTISFKMRTGEAVLNGIQLK